MNAIVNISNNNRAVGFADTAARTAGVAGRHLPLPLHLYLLPYPGTGPTGHSLTKELDF